jgi:hypothetical protein
MGTESKANGAQDESMHLLQAERLYEAGDYRTLRRALSGLRDAKSTDVRERARALERATGLDPVLAALLAACLFGLLAIAASYFAH